MSFLWEEIIFLSKKKNNYSKCIEMFLRFFSNEELGFKLSFL